MEAPDWSIFGTYLRYLRERAGLTQQELARRLHYDPGHVSNLERGTRRPPHRSTLVARFVPALHLEHKPEDVARLLELAARARGESLQNTQVTLTTETVQQATTLEDMSTPPLREPLDESTAATSSSTAPEPIVPSPPTARFWSFHQRRHWWFIGLAILLLLLVGGAGYAWYQQQPTTAKGYYERGSSYYHAGQYARAVADFTRALELRSGYDWAYYGRGSAYYQLGQHDKAIADLSQAIRYLPTYDWAYYLRGLAYQGQCEEEHAAADFRMVLDISTNAEVRQRAAGHLQAAQEDACNP